MPSGSAGLDIGSNDAQRISKRAVALAHSYSSVTNGPAADLNNHRRRTDDA
jgi:hypothetical protein